MVNALVIVGDPVTLREHIDVLLEGLPCEYKSIATLIGSRIDPFTIDEIEALLLAHAYATFTMRKNMCSFSSSNSRMIRWD